VLLYLFCPWVQISISPIVLQLLCHKIHLVGFQIGTTIYEDDLGKDEVLQIRHNGRDAIACML
jgi:hypothetical protein